jgi:hypothetical protein
MGGRKSSDDGFDGCARRNFTAILAADTIGDNEKPALAALLVEGSGDEMAEEVLVVIADSTGVGELSELDVEHGFLSVQQKLGGNFAANAPRR